MKPGARSAPVGNRRCGQLSGISMGRAIPRILPFSIRTAALACHTSHRRPDQRRSRVGGVPRGYILVCSCYGAGKIGREYQCEPSALQTQGNVARTGMDRLVIRGGKRLQGSVHFRGAKNAILPLAALVAKGETVVHRINRLDRG